MPRSLTPRHIAALVVAASVSSPTGPVVAQTAPTAVPICRPAPHPEYGVSVAQPIQVGGGPMYGSARQRRFLDSLTGPQGQRVRYERNVATMSAPDGTLVDSYVVTYDGLEKPVAIVLDWYHYTDHFAPRGFLCRRDPELGTPPPDPFAADEQLLALAAEVAAAPGFRAGPVDLGRDPVEGIIVDRFRLQSRRARAGAPAKKGDVPGTVVVAYPQTCGGTSTPALGIALSGRQGPAIEPTSLITDRAAVQAVLPGAEIPAGSIAATFAVDALLNGFGVRLSFPPSVCVGPTAERLPVIQYRGAELATPSMPVRPSDDDSGVAFVAVQAIVDHQGRFQQLRPLGGPPTLVRAALAAVAQWQAQPARANGAPVATAVVLRVTFEAAGKQ